MDKIPLPSGGWVLLRDPEDVTEAARRPQRLLMSSIMDVDLERPNPQQIGVMNDVNDLLAVSLIAEWSFDTPITTESLMALTGPDYDAVQTVVAPLFLKVHPSFAVNPAPESPTSPSSS